MYIFSSCMVAKRGKKKAYQASEWKEDGDEKNISKRKQGIIVGNNYKRDMNRMIDSKP